MRLSPFSDTTPLLYSSCGIDVTPLTILVKE